MRRFCVEVLSALTRSTHFCNGDEGEFLTRKNDRAIAPGAASYISRSIPLLAETRIHFLRWTELPDRDDAHRVGREKTLDRQLAISARLELLHVASRPGSTATRHLYRLALASNLGRYRRRSAFRDSINLHPLGAELHLCRLWSRSLDCRGLLWIETGRARHCGRGCHSHRQ